MRELLGSSVDRSDCWTLDHGSNTNEPEEVPSELEGVGGRLPKARESRAKARRQNGLILYQEGQLRPYDLLVSRSAALLIFQVLMLKYV